MSHDEWDRGYYFGIDPGLKGAMVALDRRGNLVGWTRMPIVEGKNIDFLRIDHYLCRAMEPCVCIERVHAMPKQGVTSMFTFGKGYGGLLALIEVRSIPVINVLPRAWQKEMLPECPKGGTKDEAVRRALELWPDLGLPLKKKVNQGIADAALLAEYGRRSWLEK